MPLLVPDQPINQSESEGRRPEDEDWIPESEARRAADEGTRMASSSPPGSDSAMLGHDLVLDSVSDSVMSELTSSSTLSRTQSI